MSADFWAGYASGVVGIVVGNPLDIIKIRHQTQSHILASSRAQSSSALVKGTAAPILGYGALNALLFVSYNRSEAVLSHSLSTKNSLVVCWLAGAVGGLATWVVSAPTELIKCRTQLSVPPTSSWSVARQIWMANGVKGLYFGGLVTALRDSIGYGFYFWSYELANRCWPTAREDKRTSSLQQDMPRILLCGGFAGIATWSSIFPLDVIKSRLQTQPWSPRSVTAMMQPMGRHLPNNKRAGAWQITKDVYRDGGLRPFFRGLTICSTRAFVVNAVQWAVYEGIMHEMGHGREQRAADLEVAYSI
ncbi:Mitochondrial basic amino acids transporter [Cladobotryum mycophilum]|uniref:Mitochondrial basic amino acids transporter n=1 Tax=Cladobotryum mycophilum TaxID=491253 RepID=A0ABR0SN06_9HYPO